jgi:hypothetical protein
MHRYKPRCFGGGGCIREYLQYLYSFGLFLMQFQVASLAGVGERLSSLRSERARLEGLADEVREITMQSCRVAAVLLGSCR